MALDGVAVATLVLSSLNTFMLCCCMPTTGGVYFGNVRDSQNGKKLDAIYDAIVAVEPPVRQELFRPAAN